MAAQLIEVLSKVQYGHVQYLNGRKLRFMGKM